VEVRFWGVRGSIPTPGAETQRWGGNSSCVEVRHADWPPLILDCGTGVRRLGIQLVGHPTRQVDVLFSHFHMDHVFGFPFFVPIYTPNFEVRVAIPAYTEEEARDKLGRYLNGVFHPARLRELPARLSYNPIRPGKEFQAGKFKVLGHALNHPGGAVGYRIEAEGRSIAYITDTAPFAKPGEGVMGGQEPPPAEARFLEFIRGCDLVVFDTMYELDEYLEKMTWGHSYPEYAQALCKAAGVKHLVLFHHLPDADDDAMDEKAKKWASATEPRVSLAREGETVTVEG
jgi:phosphoribosyl 1,2-cyclic phosphodiesterase